ncbi:MAG: bifunctional 2-C-methyl-D-erythritol 4-phosphate cytidylyltransferase/2-C-methyl-D-erythritol 2,4-cyclodiphosphate synthase [Pseudomonadota bacterium]
MDFKHIGAVIVAAGRGARAGLDGPKQYHNLAGTPVIARTLAALSVRIDTANIVIVRHADDQDLLEDALSGQTANIKSVSGGQTRQQSVLAGLQELAQDAPSLTHIMIHDAARPFVSERLLDDLFEVIAQNPNAGVLPVVPITSTIKRIHDDKVEETIPRTNLTMAQTPQLFPAKQILDAHLRAQHTDEPFTDDASIFEWAGLTVKTIPGEEENIKLTYPDDFARAERTLNMAAMESLPDIRTGNGYDVHRFVEGDHVVLCGISIPFDKGLSGHSDADVGLHALTDALLATCGAGDIGDHFPPTDPKWKGAESYVFLAEAVRIVGEKGGTILNVDITLICEAPKIGPHKTAMRENLARICAIDVDRCSVKATTNENMGFIGRREGMGAISTASVRYT